MKTPPRSPAPSDCQVFRVRFADVMRAEAYSVKNGWSLLEQIPVPRWIDDEPISNLAKAMYRMAFIGFFGKPTYWTVESLCEIWQDERPFAENEKAVRELIDKGYLQYVVRRES